MSALTAIVFGILFSHVVLIPAIWVFGSWYGLRWLNARILKYEPNNPPVRYAKLFGAWAIFTGLLLCF